MKAQMKLVDNKIKMSRNKTYDIISVIFAVICVFVVLLCFFYYSVLKLTLKEENRAYMMELSDQMSSNIERNISDHFSVLGNIGTTIVKADLETFSQLSEYINEVIAHWGYNKIMLIDGDAKTYDENGIPVRFESNEYLQTVYNGKYSISTSEKINGIESVVFAIPIDITLEGKTMFALAASYDLETFDKILNMNVFEGKGYAHIIRADGTAVIKSTSANAILTGFNILNSLSTAKFADGIKLADIKESIRQSNSGFSQFEVDGLSQYMTYIPLTIKDNLQIDWRLLTFVPVDVVGIGSNAMLMFSMFLSIAVSISFAALFALLMTSASRNRRKLEHVAYVDDVTGGNTIKLFNELASKILQDSSSQHALLYINIAKFKLLNEQFGKISSDDILKLLDNSISRLLEKDECIARQQADNFCMLVRYTTEENLLSRINQWKTNFRKTADERRIVVPPFSIEFGVYVIADVDMEVNQMIDRAKLSLTETTNVVEDNFRMAIYDESVRLALVREKHLEDRMGQALADNEFEVYLQPKYLTKSEEIGGAEALVRWVSEKNEVIYPDEFIPLFEKNGFITKLDLYVFEEVCKTIRKWLDCGVAPVKISVNCSRVNLKYANLIEKYYSISSRYDVPAKYIEIEFTESVVFGNVEVFTDIITQIHKIGYGCSMDDFGSGYSSLSLIQDISVDTLKLDKVFFRKQSKADERSQSVVANIISLAKALNMVTVAEGVEEKVQVEMLKKLGCDMIQGYYFARPMVVSQFEKIKYGRTL